MTGCPPENRVVRVDGEMMRIDVSNWVVSNGLNGLMCSIWVAVPLRPFSQPESLHNIYIVCDLREGAVKGLVREVVYRVYLA